MRKNLPVVDVETAVPDGEFIYSRTNLHGVIVELNDAFARISGYTAQEMLGQPHNLVRHPDMPEEAFADLWRDLKEGRPWRGLVKNRRKDGGYYWVEANVSPVREYGQVVGYQSIRAKPERDEVQAAEMAYRRLRAGDKTLVVEHGAVIAKRGAWRSRLQSLPFQVAMFGSLVALSGGISIVASHGGIAWLEGVDVVLDVLSLLLGLYAAIRLAPKIRRDLQLVSDAIEAVLRTGRLTQHIGMGQRNEIGRISRQFDELTAWMRATIKGMIDTANSVARISTQVGVAVQQANQSAMRQNEATSASAAAIEEVTVAVGEVSVHAANTHATSAAAGTLALEGVQLSVAASDKIQFSAQTVQSAADQVSELGRRTEAIHRVTTVIREIADQTNLLALNAAIEAARAGEQGRGFAVVADEVRKLAERTSRATDEIGGMINAILVETQKAVVCMQDGSSQVGHGVLLVAQAKGALEQINVRMGETVLMVSDISSSAAEQERAMAELSRNISKVVEMTDENAQAMAHTQAMSGELDHTVGRMRIAIAQYSV